MSILKSIGLALIGKKNLAAMNGETTNLARTTLLAEQAGQPLTTVAGRVRLEQFFANTLAERSAPGDNQITAALLVGLAGSTKAAEALVAAAAHAEGTGEGFMKKKAAVLKVAKSLDLSKSQCQLAIELAVQLIKG